MTVSTANFYLFFNEYIFFHYFDVVTWPLFDCMDRLASLLLLDSSAIFALSIFASSTALSWSILPFSMHDEHYLSHPFFSLVIGLFTGARFLHSEKN